MLGRGIEASSSTCGSSTTAADGCRPERRRNLETLSRSATGRWASDREAFFFPKHTHKTSTHRHTHTDTHKRKKNQKTNKTPKRITKTNKQTKKKLPRNGGGVRCIFVVFRCFLSFASQILVDDSIKWFKRIVKFFFVSESEMEEAGGVGGAKGEGAGLQVQHDILQKKTTKYDN